MLKAIPTAVLVVLLSGCANRGLPITQADIDERSRAKAAQEAIDRGIYPLAESILAEFVYRDEKGSLKVKYWGLNGETRKMVIDSSMQLLWETERYASAEEFANEYLSGSERATMICRLAEQQRQFERAYSCWNQKGDPDRAERVLRSAAVVKILGDK